MKGICAKTLFDVQVTPWPTYSVDGTNGPFFAVSVKNREWAKHGDGSFSLTWIANENRLVESNELRRLKKFNEQLAEDVKDHLQTKVFCAHRRRHARRTQGVTLCNSA